MKPSTKMSLKDYSVVFGVSLKTAGKIRNEDLLATGLPFMTIRSVCSRHCLMISDVLDILYPFRNKTEKTT